MIRRRRARLLYLSYILLPVQFARETARQRECKIGTGKRRKMREKKNETEPKYMSKHSIITLRVRYYSV